MIDEFLSCLRENWPAASITLKLHILEKHVIPFIEKWKAGCGFYGEHGGESIHQVLKKMKNRYTQIKNASDRVKLMMEEHLRGVSPNSTTLRPAKRQRKQ